MSNYYYEFSDEVAANLGWPKYIAHTNPFHGHSWATIYMNGRSLGHMAERVWREDEDGVHFVKNRFGGHAADVDLKEFMWIKLKS